MAGRIRRMWDALKRPPVRLSLGAVLIIGAVSAWVAWGSFVFVIEQTSTNDFCAGACHEMNISFVEYQQSVHAHNATGVTATCSQCHIPQALDECQGHPQDTKPDGPTSLARSRA